MFRAALPETQTEAEHDHRSSIKNTSQTNSLTLKEDFDLRILCILMSLHNASNTTTEQLLAITSFHPESAWATKTTAIGRRLLQAQILRLRSISLRSSTF